MMLDVNTARDIIQVVILFLTYVWVVTLLGYTRAYVAHRMGDSTAAMLGYMTFDPIKHVSPFAFAMLFILRVGWGNSVPIYLSNIQGSYARLRRAIALFSDSILAFFLATVSLIMFYGMVVVYPNILVDIKLVPSIVAVLVKFLIATYSLSLFLMILNMVINLSIWLLWVFSKKSSLYNPYIFAFAIVLPTLVYFFLGTHVHILMQYLVAIVASGFYRLLGM